MIAAGRLDDRLIGDALGRLPGARFDRWIDEGDAADLHVEGDPADVRAALSALDRVDVAIQAEPRVVPRLFVADMDSTMIGQECIDELADFAGFKAEVAAVTERAMRGEIDFAQALAERVACLEGLNATLIGQCLATRIHPTAGAAALVATLKERGVLTVLVSGGFEDFVYPIGARLGFDRMHANRLSATGGRLSGTTEGPIIDSASKRRIAEEALSEIGAGTDALVAVGDGANDIPMIELAGLGLGYRPKPALEVAADGVIRHHDLTAALWMLGIPRREWLISP